MNSSAVTPPPNSTMASINGDKLSGQLIIKAQLGDDIRKMMIHNEELTLNELILMMQRIFSGKISNSDDITIKYLDDDEDKITLLTDSDLTVALHFHKVLRLFVFVNGQELVDEKSSDDKDKQGNLIDAKTFRTELQQIRNSVQTILDRLQASNDQSEKESPTPVTTSQSNVVPTSAREFDPLKNVSHLQQNQPRSTTPDSVRSKSSVTYTYNNAEQKTQQNSTAGQTQSLESNDSSVSTPANYGSAQMPTAQQQYVPPSFVSTPGQDQQTKTSAFGAPPTTFPGMPPMPQATTPSRYPTGFPPNNTLAQSSFNPTGSMPPPTITNASAPGQPATFIGQQSAPPQSAGFYAQQQQQQPPQQQQQQQQQSFYNPRPPNVGFNQMNPNNSYAPQNQVQTQQPPTSSSPATINPSFIAPPPMASQQPYGGYQPQQPYYNPVQGYPKQN